MESYNQRYWLIELLLYWQGGVNASDLRKAFNLSRQQAQKILNDYKTEFKDKNITYNKHSKYFEANHPFQPNFISRDVSEYLNWITGITPAMTLSSISHQSILHPPRLISPEIIRPLIQAIRHKKRVDVEYLSVSSASTEGRIIAPHTLVNTGFRWHVRGWCEKSGEFRDFVLSRFKGTPELQDNKTEYGVEKDTAWNTSITLLLRPDPRLTAEQQAVIEKDYMMVNGELAIQTRAALAHYTLQSLQVSTKVLDANPAAQQLILVNYEAVKEWLF